VRGIARNNNNNYVEISSAPEGRAFKQEVNHESSFIFCEFYQSTKVLKEETFVSIQRPGILFTNLLHRLQRIIFREISLVEYKRLPYLNALGSFRALFKHPQKILP